jgi:outer membrane receptor protein involved in Fe transport
MLGVRFSPASHPKLSLDAQYYNIVSYHQVLPTPLLPKTLFSDPQYSYLYTRGVAAATLADICSQVTFIGTPGQCQSSAIGAIVDLRLRSAETVKTDGFDLKALYGFDARGGQLSLNLQATYVLHFEEALTPRSEFINFRNTPHNPTALRLRAGLGWENQLFFVSPAINLQGSYTDNISVPNRPVGAWMTWDLVMGYKLGALPKVPKSDTMISLRGLNIFNRQPPFLNNNIGYIGYDPENADLLGRRLSLKIELEW